MWQTNDCKIRWPNKQHLDLGFRNLIYRRVQSFDDADMASNRCAMTFVDNFFTSYNHRYSRYLRDNLDFGFYLVEVYENVSLKTWIGHMHSSVMILKVC